MRRAPPAATAAGAAPRGTSAAPVSPLPQLPQPLLPVGPLPPPAVALAFADGYSHAHCRRAQPWSLAGMARRLLARGLTKPERTRCGGWEKVPLAPGQLAYAALDAVQSE